MGWFQSLLIADTLEIARLLQGLSQRQHLHQIVNCCLSFIKATLPRVNKMRTSLRQPCGTEDSELAKNGGFLRNLPEWPGVEEQNQKYTTTY
jgi:hypothetical protein